MMKSVKFKHNNIDMAGNLYLPEGMDESKKYPAIVCVHPGGGVKEQTSGLYAENLSKQGFITLAFDASYQGESGGEPRLLEDPSERVEDVHCAVDYLTTLPYVDVDNIGVLGICAGGGYAINASQSNHRIKAVAGISSVDIGGLFRAQGKEASLATIQAANVQRTAEANGAELQYIPWVPNSLEEIDENTTTLMREAYDYYRTPRAQHPNSTNRFLFRSVEKILTFSAFSNLDTLLTQPLLIIAGAEADTLMFSEEAYEKAASEDKELFLIEGATHVDMYDIPKYVNPALEKLTIFFNKNLK